MESKENMSKNDFLIKNQEKINIMKQYLSEIEEMGGIDPIRGMTLLKCVMALLEYDADKRDDYRLKLALEKAKLRKVYDFEDIRQYQELDDVNKEINKMIKIGNDLHSNHVKNLKWELFLNGKPTSKFSFKFVSNKKAEKMEKLLRTKAELEGKGIIIEKD